MKSIATQSLTYAAASRTFPGRSRCRVSKSRKAASCWSCHIEHSQLYAGGTPLTANAPTVSHSLPPTFPRKFADVDWCSRKINPNKICAECWPGAAFGPYWLLTERLRYETTPLLPALRDRVHVHGRRDVAYGSHRRSYAASRNRRAAGASRRNEQRRRQGRRRHQHKHDSRYRRGQHRNIHRHQRSQHGKRLRHQYRHHRRNRHPRPIPQHPDQPHTRRNLHHVTNRLRPLRNRKPKRRHLHRLVERRPRGHRDDLPRNPDQRLVPGQGAHGRVHLWDGGSQESVCDPSRQAWASYYSLRARARDRAQRIHVGPQFTCMELAKVPIPNQKW